MPTVALSSQAYDRAQRGGAVEILLNMYAEIQPESDGRKLTLLSAPGLVPWSEGFDGNTRAMEAKDGLFSGDIFSISGGTAYRTNRDGMQTVLGTVPVTGNVSIAIGRQEVLFCVAPNLYSYDGGSFVQVDMAGQPCGSITEIGQRFVGSVLNGDRFYWSDLLDGRTWDGLNFATAEGESDNIVRAYATNQYVYLYGTETVEIFGQTTNPRNPSEAFYNINNAAMEHGLLSYDSLAHEDQILVWLSSRKTIYLSTGFNPTKISTPYVQDLLEKLTVEQLQSAVAYTYTQVGHTFYVFTVPGEFTLSYDLGRQKWEKRQTHPLKEWGAARAVETFGLIITAPIVGGTLSELNIKAKENVIQEFSVVIPAVQPFRLSDLTLDMWSDTAGLIHMRHSANGGRTWSAWIEREMTSPDEENRQVLFRRLGTVRAPERIIQFRISNPANVTITRARINDGLN